MKNMGKTILVTALYVCLLFLQAQAQKLADKLRFKHLTVQNGLRSNAIQAIVQDYEGYIWIGTENGLHKYDGYSVVAFTTNENDTTSIQDNSIAALVEDGSHNLWVATLMGLDLYDRRNHVFKHLPLILEEEVAGKVEKKLVKEYYVSSLFKDSHDNIYVCTRGKDIYVLDKKNSCVRVFDRRLKVDENQVRAEDKHGNLYLSTVNGAFQLNPQKRTMEEIALFDDEHKKLTYESYFVFIDPNSDTWIPTNLGLFRIDHKTSKTTRFEHNPLDPSSIPDHFISYIYADQFQNIWFCSTQGLFTYNRKSNTFTTCSSSGDGLSSNKIKSVFVDKGGILWVGNYTKGVDYAPLKNSTNFQLKRFPTLKDKSENTEPSFFYKDKKEKSWLATNGDGLRLLDKDFRIQQAFTHSDAIPTSVGTNTILSIFEDRDGDLWMGGFYGGLNKYTTKGTFEKYHLSLFSPPPLQHLTNEIKDIIEDDQKNLVIATNGAGIFSFNKVSKKARCYTTSPHPFQGISSNWCTSLCRDKKGFIWIGSYYGLTRWDTKKNVFTSYFHKDKDSTSLESNVVYTVYNDEEDNVWVGTRKGLCLFQPKTNNFKVYKQADGLQEDYISNSIRDKQGNLWVSTYSGISRFDIKNSKFTNYTYEDGLSGSLFVNNSCFKDKDGVLYFPAADGLTYFNPQHFTDQHKEIRLYITEFRLFDKAVLPGTQNSPLKENISDTQEITLPHNKSFLSFRYTGIHYLLAGQIQYAYKLAGFDNNWHYVGSERTATFSNLDPGTYTFNVKATAQDGQWYYLQHPVRITIKAPFWKTGWAYSLYLLLALLIAYGVFKFLRFKYRLQQAVEQERLKAEQEQHLHNLKLHFFTNVSHDLRTPLTLIMSPLEEILSQKNIHVELKRQLSFIFNHTKKLYSLVNELMDFTKSEYDKLRMLAQPGDLVKFSRGVFEIFSVEAQRRHIDYRFISQVDSLEAWYDQGKLERILINLLSNAFKYTRNHGQVRVEITLGEGSHAGNVFLSVVDNGSGIAEAYLEKIFERFFQSPEEDNQHLSGTGIGLALVKNLVELHHGTISVTSEKWARTCFKVSLPLGKEHFQESELLPASAEGNEPIMRLEELTESGLSNLTRKPTVLVVEDNPELRAYLCSVLTNEYQLIEAGDGLTGFQLAKEQVPDLIVSDIMMPVMSGTEMCEKIKMEVATSHIPVILLTAKASLDDHILGIETGADAYITKPFSVQLLRVHIKKLIETRRVLFQRFSQEAYMIPKEISTHPLDQKFLQRVIDYIEDNLDDPNLNVESIAEHAMLSQSQTYRKIKALTGQHINEFVRTIRLKKAIKLFDAGEDNVSEVAFKVGFSSPAYFTKCFREQFNTTPTNFLKSNKTGKEDR